MLLRTMVPSSVKRFIPLSLKKWARRAGGDYFQNDGAINEADFDEMRREIDRIRPKVFIEIGTGTGISTRKLFGYLRARNIPCDFYTIEIFSEYHTAIAKEIVDPRFHAIHGLSVRAEETENPARDELQTYTGPQNVLRQLLDTTLAGRRVDMAFIDSRKGTALPEFKILAERLASNGAIFCHDILNRDKAVEVVEFVKTKPDTYTYRIVDTGPNGIVQINLRASNA